MGLIYGDTSWGHTTGSGRWDWFVGARHWGVTLVGHIMGARDWIREMGLICRDTPWGCDTGWMWMMRLIYGGIPWGRATGSERWNWFVEANHGAWQWLDLGEGIDSCRHVMRATLAGLGLWDWFIDWFMGACRMTKYYMVAECKWQSTIWLLNVNDDTMCLMSGVEVSVQSVFG